MKYLLVILITFLSFTSCEKDESSPAKVAGNVTTPDLQVQVYSNFKYPFLRIDQDTTVLKYINFNVYETEQVLSYSHQTLTPGQYMVYSQSSTNAGMIHMLNSDPIWNRTVVTLYGQVVYDSTITLNMPPHSAYCTYQFEVTQ